MIIKGKVSSKNERIGTITDLHLKIATLLLFFIILLFRVLFGFTGLYGQDAYEYTRYASRIFSFIINGVHPGDYFWPVLYPVTGALLNFIIGNIAFSLQLISMMSFCGIFYFLNKIIYLIHNSSKNSILIYCGLLFALSPIVLRSTFFVMSDMFAMLLLILAIFNSIKFYQSLISIHFYAVAFFSAAAVMTRYPAAIILIIPIAVVLNQFLKHFNWKDLLISFVIVCIVFLPHILIRWDNPTAFAGHEFVENWSVMNFFKDEMANNSGVFKYRFVNIIHAFFAFVHPGYIFFGIVILPFIRKIDFKKPVLLFVLLPILIYTLFIAGLPYQNIRYLLLHFPLILIFLYPAFKRFINFLSVKKLPIGLIFTFIVILQLLLFYRAFIPFYKLNKLERSIADQLQHYPHQKIISFGMDVSLRYNLKDKEIINFMEAKKEGNLTNTLFLINEEAFLQQYKTTEWEIYLKEFTTIYQPVKLQQLSNGWILYELKN